MTFKVSKILLNNKNIHLKTQKISKKRRRQQNTQDFSLNFKRISRKNSCRRK